MLLHISSENPGNLNIWISNLDLKRGLHVGICVRTSILGFHDRRPGGNNDGGSTFLGEGRTSIPFTTKHKQVFFLFLTGREHWQQVGDSLTTAFGHSLSSHPNSKLGYSWLVWTVTFTKLLSSRICWTFGNVCIPLAWEVVWNTNTAPLTVWSDRNGFIKGRTLSTEANQGISFWTD